MSKYYIRPEGISKPCPYHAAVYTEQDLELAENKEFILEGVHVWDAFEIANLREQNKTFRLALKFYSDFADKSNHELIFDDESGSRAAVYEKYRLCHIGEFGVRAQEVLARFPELAAGEEEK